MSSLRSWKLARLGFALLMALTIAGMAGISVAAQDASPTPAVCDSPGLPPGTPTPMEPEASPVASPEAMEGMDMGTPEPVEVPPMPVPPEGTPADAGMAATITAAVENYAACYNEGQSSGDPGLYVALQTERFWMDSSGTANPYDVVVSEAEGPPMTAQVQSIENPMTLDDGRVSADVHVLLGDHWLAHNRMVFALGNDMTWKLDEESYLQPEPVVDTISVVGIDIVETTDEATGQVTYEFVFPGGSTTISQTEGLIFTVSNTGAELHEAVMVQLPEGADPLGLLDGSVAFEDVQFLGGVFPVWPGETKELALLNLEPGVYTLLCFFPGPDGAPHAVNGMVAQVEIVAAAS
jgi:hypothetical protein